MGIDLIILIGCQKSVDKIKELQQLLSEKEKTLKELLLLYQNMCDQITKDQKEIEYWKQRCEVVEKMYGMLNADFDHQEEYKHWKQLKNQKDI